MKQLKELIVDVSCQETIGSLDKEVASVFFDSRKAVADSLFVAQKGTLVDGHNYIEQAISKGATVVVCEILPVKIDSSTTYLKVADASLVLASLAAAFYDHPSRELTLIGVTGTNGKTTIATLLYAIFQMLGFRVGLLSTVCNFVGKEKRPATHTTPDSVQLNALLREMLDAGCTHCFMEVSSHAIAQNRTAYLMFDGGIFTNLSHDHLDYHNTFKEYLTVKKRFFDELPKTAFALTNVDDKNGHIMLQNTPARKQDYAVRSLATFKARNLEKHFDATLIEIDGNELWVQFIGNFNTYNLLAVYGCCTLLGVPKEDVLNCLSKLKPVDGRFESFVSTKGVIGIVDYAHTPDALRNVLETINEIIGETQTLITVVGCGGDRDKTKRPEMAKIAANLSGRLILTSDNPRTEDPSMILEDMKAGLEEAQLRHTLTISDRKEAIRTAAALAAPHDVVLVAGKGHETYQDKMGVKTYFNDKEELKNALN